MRRHLLNILCVAGFGHTSELPNWHITCLEFISEFDKGTRHTKRHIKTHSNKAKRIISRVLEKVREPNNTVGLVRVRVRVRVRVKVRVRVSNTKTKDKRPKITAITKAETKTKIKTRQDHSPNRSQEKLTRASRFFVERTKPQASTKDRRARRDGQRQRPRKKSSQSEHVPAETAHHQTDTAGKTRQAEGRGRNHRQAQKTGEQSETGQEQSLRRANTCEHYELKIDYVAMDQVCTWSHYQVDILLYD